jgi:propionyl-CoA synthetase
MEFQKRQNASEKTKQNYYKNYYLSINNTSREKFWYQQCDEIDFYKKPSINHILDKSNPPFYLWFPDSELNICYNCVDRHIKNGLGNNNAIIFESYYLNKIIKYTYNDLFKEILNISFILKSYGVNKGDRIVIYMPTIPEAIISMLACCRIGAIHSVVFGGFAYSELAERIKDCKPKMIITTSCGIEPKRKIEYYPIVRKALDLISKNNKIKILLFQREDALITKEKDIIYTDTLVYNEQLNLFKNKKISNIEPENLKGKDLFFILYTSGTSGIPKGIVRDLSSIVTINYTMKYIMNVHKNDICFSTSDIGWIVGHVFMVYGPILRGATTILFEGKPVGTPNSGKVWDIIKNFMLKLFKILLTL